jgi:shikimate kinase
MRHLYLIGNMGSGKTTVGKLVAERLGLPFYDLDQWIEQATGLTITELFAQQGEARFRDPKLWSPQAAALCCGRPTAS